MIVTVTYLVVIFVGGITMEYAVFSKKDCNTFRTDIANSAVKNKLRRHNILDMYCTSRRVKP